MDARIVKEVKVGAVLGRGDALGGFHAGNARVVRPEERQLPGFVAHGQGAVIHPVVAGDREQGGLAGGQQGSDVRLKGGEAALVFGHKLTVQPDVSRVGDSLEPQDDPLPGAERGQGDRPLIPGPAVVTAQGRGLIVLVVVAGRHRNGLWVRQRLCRVELGGILTAQLEVPGAIQAQF